MQNLDIIGVLYSTDEEPVALPGWHVNSPFQVEGWGQYEVLPSSPRRVFAGHPTYCYVFESKEAFVALTGYEPPVALDELVGEPDEASSVEPEPEEVQE